MRDDRSPEQIEKDKAEHERVLRELETNDPPVEPGQVWSMRDPDDPVTVRRWGGVIRADRVLAPYPDPVNSLEEPDPRDPKRGWIVESAGFPQSVRREGLGVCPEYNLRRLFRLDPALTEALAAAKEVQQDLVWVAVQHYAPDSIPRKPKVEHVFGSETAAVAWRREGVERGAFGGYREVIPMELERGTSIAGGVLDGSYDAPNG